MKSRIKEITKLILGSFAIYFVMAACASGSIRQGFKDLADAASDGNINGVGDALSELADAATGYSDVSFISPVDAAKAESGSRLKRVQIQGDDGSIADQFAFFDSQRNEDCYYTQTTSDYVWCYTKEAIISTKVDAEYKCFYGTLNRLFCIARVSGWAIIYDNAY